MGLIRDIIDISNDEYYFRCVLFRSFDVFSFQKNAQERLLFRFMGLRFTITKKRLKSDEIISLNSKYESGDLSELTVPIVKNSRQTLDELITTNKSLVRYGDGELNLVFGEDLPFQIYSKELAKRMKEILLSNDDNIMVSLPDMFGSLTQYEPITAQFWRKYVVLHREKLYKIFDMSKTYYDTEVTRAYIGVEDKSVCEKHFEDFKKVWQDKDIVIVEGSGSRLGVGNDLFDGAKSIQRIICPSRDAFSKYEEIKNACLGHSKGKLFILALGPTATVLAYDLAKEGYRALDVGHLDIEYEWMKHHALEKILIKDKYVNEVKGGRKITVIHDEKYLNEICLDLSEEMVNDDEKFSFKEFASSMFSVQPYGETHYLVKFLGFKIKFPKAEFKKKKESNPYYYYKENNIDITKIPPAEGQIRDIQRANLALLKELDYVCKQNGLKYWLDFGTVLGAVRHKGFIPWDDDIDVGMIRDDYDKIVEAFEKSSRNPDIYAELSWGKDAQFVLIKVMHKKAPHLFVDIFPYDVYGEKLTEAEQLERTEWIKARREYLRAHNKPKNIAQIKQMIKQGRKELLKEVTTDKPDIVWGADYNHHWRNWFTSYDVAFPLKEIEFEGQKFYCMNNVDKFLTNVYRDYMAYPKKIGFGHSMFVNLRRSEREVIENLIKKDNK